MARKQASDCRPQHRTINYGSVFWSERWCRSTVVLRSGKRTRIPKQCHGKELPYFSTTTPLTLSKSFLLCSALKLQYADWAFLSLTSPTQPVNPHSGFDGSSNLRLDLSCCRRVFLQNPRGNTPFVVARRAPASRRERKAKPMRGIFPIVENRQDCRKAAALPATLGSDRHTSIFLGLSR